MTDAEQISDSDTPGAIDPDLDPEPGASLDADPERLSLAESDLALFDALQENPRGSWAAIAQRTGLSAATARRRWQRLESSSAAWITTYPGDRAGIVRSSVEVVCAPASIPEVARRLCDHPRIMNVAESTGDVDILLVVLTRDLTEMRAVIRAISAIPGVTHVRSSLMTRVYREGSRWRAGALPRVAGAVPRRGSVSRDIGDARIRGLLRLLEADGRAPATTIAQEMGVSDAYARRYVASLVRHGVLVQRVDLALDRSDWPNSLVLHMAAPAATLDSTAAAISALPGTRLCAGLAGGPHNLIAVVWLHSIQEALEVEARVTGSLDLTVTHRSILLHYHKRMGHLFDARQRRIGRISWTDPAP